MIDNEWLVENNVDVVTAHQISSEFKKQKVNSFTLNEITQFIDNPIRLISIMFRALSNEKKHETLERVIVGYNLFDRVNNNETVSKIIKNIHDGAPLKDQFGILSEYKDYHGYDYFHSGSSFANDAFYYYLHYHKEGRISSAVNCIVALINCSNDRMQNIQDIMKLLEDKLSAK